MSFVGRYAIILISSVWENSIYEIFRNNRKGELPSMEVTDIIDAMRTGVVFAVDVRGIEHVGSDPNTFRTAMLYKFDGRVVPEKIWSGDLTEAVISKVISQAGAEFNPLWSAFDFEYVQGIPVAQTIRYYSAVSHSKPVWIAEPKAP